MPVIESAMDEETIVNEIENRDWFFSDDEVRVDMDVSGMNYPTGVRIVVTFDACVSSGQIGVFTDPVFEAVSVHHRHDAVAVHLTPVF